MAPQNQFLKLMFWSHYVSYKAVKEYEISEQ